MILPRAVATISIHPKVAHNIPAVKTAKMVQRIVRPMGEGGAC
jgi:hypothetical protein